MLLLLLLTMLAGSQPGPGKPPIELSFDRVSARAGDEVRFPISLVSDFNSQEPFQILLPFPASALTFVKVETGYLASEAAWTFAAAAKDHPTKAGTRVVQIDVKPGGAAFFPSGVVAYVVFKVTEGAHDGDIPIEGSLVLPPSSTPIAAAEPGRINVFTKALFGCFFYMH